MRRSPAEQNPQDTLLVSLLLLEETVNAAGSSLSDDARAGLYTHIWKTDKLWANSCRELQLMLNDGEVYRARFTLRKSVIARRAPRVPKKLRTLYQSAARHAMAHSAVELLKVPEQWRAKLAAWQLARTAELVGESLTERLDSPVESA